MSSSRSEQPVSDAPRWGNDSPRGGNDVPVDQSSNDPLDGPSRSASGTVAPSLQSLANDGSRLAIDYHFDWPLDVQHGVAALLFKELLASMGSGPATPPLLVAIVGGASSGKSTLFNNLLNGHQVSRVSIRGHATLGPILAIHEKHRDEADEWLVHARTLLPMLTARSRELDAETTGVPDGLEVVYHLVDELGDVLLFDTPDFTSEPARREGDLTLAVLPWFDRLVVMLDHERWFDRQSIAHLRQRSVRLGQDRMAVFNRTQEGDLADSDRRKLAVQASRLGADVHCVLPFRRGRGFRRLPDALTDDIRVFLSQPAPERVDVLRRWIGDACNEVLNANDQRRHDMRGLRSALDRAATQAVPSAWECMMALMTPAERKHLDPISRILGLADSRQWMARQRTRLSELLGSVPIVGAIVGSRNPRPGVIPPEADATRLADGQTDRASLGCEHARATFAEQCYTLRGQVEGSDFVAELPTSAWPSSSTNQDAGSEEFTDRAAKAVDELDRALTAWNSRVENECHGVSPRLAGATGAVGIVTIGVLIAVQGPVAALTVPAAAAALSAALGKLALAAGAGAVAGKQVGRLARVIQERLHVSPEFEAVGRATEVYRRVLADHARTCAARFAAQAQRLVLGAEDPLLQALETHRRPIDDGATPNDGIGGTEAAQEQRHTL